MKLSSKSLTAIKLFIDLGEHYNEGFISIVDVAKRKDLSKKFIEQIVPDFKRSGLLLVNRGNQGGYKLSKCPSEITLKDIVYITENNLIENKTNDEICDYILLGINNLLDEYFSNITLDKLIEKQISSYSNNYVI